MKNINKRFYDKAMKHYQNGDLVKSLKFCEEGLSNSLKNSSILNLKGLILYQQGKLEEAVTVWKINKTYNNDNIAENYIKSAKKDEVRVELYELGEKKLKELNLEEAIVILKKCRESDFNCIKVNSALALCYQKKGDIENCLQYMNKVLAIDKNYIVAKQIKKQLIELKAYKSKSNNSIKWIVASLTIVCVCVSIYFLKDKLKLENKNNIQINKGDEDKNEVVTSSEPSETAETAETAETVEEVKAEVQEEVRNKKVALDIGKLNQYIENGEADNIYYALEKVNEKDVSDNDKGVYRRCIDLLKTSGIEEFYRKGMEEFNKQNYENAHTEFNKAYIYSNDNYLKEHILFYNAVTLEKLNNFNEAIKLYESYYSEYPNSSYSDNALYNLSLIFNTINKDKSIYYANKLVDNFPDSIYVNETISKILNS